MCGKLDFTPPQGSIPESVKPGETFDLVCTFKVNQDGKTVCLTVMGDKDMEPEKAAAPSYSGMASQMQSDMATSQGAS